jgi:hypothetical protein
MSIGVVRRVRPILATLQNGVTDPFLHVAGETDVAKAHSRSSSTQLQTARSGSAGSPPGLNPAQ